MVLPTVQLGPSKKASNRSLGSRWHNHLLFRLTLPGCIQIDRPRVPQFLVSIRNRGSWSGARTPRTTPTRCGWRRRFPAIITRAQFQRVGRHLSSRAPKFSHPRRVGSSYLLSGLLKCKTCKTPLIGRFAQSGKYSYYVCQSNIKLGRDACKTPTLNARRFEELVVAKIRSDILAEDGNPRPGKGGGRGDGRRGPGAAPESLVHQVRTGLGQILHYMWMDSGATPRIIHGHLVVEGPWGGSE